MSEEVVVEHFPKRGGRRRAIEAPVREVTLLEDRAQVRRLARVELEAGQHRLVVEDVAPTLQDVSVRASILGGAEARVTDASARRAIRARRRDKPEEARELEEQIDALQRRFHETQAAQQRAEERYGVVMEMAARGAEEIPEDAGWGMADEGSWQDTFSTLFERARALQSEALERFHQLQDLQREIEQAVFRRQLLSRPDQQFVAWIELDVIVDEAGGGPLEIALDYVTPNALWRPLHSARLDADGQLHVTSKACVWQRTGEDWQQADLVFSTARSSLGVAPPILHDDWLQAQRKSEELMVAAREVAVQRARPEATGAPPQASKPAPPQGVELPGVDDGGEVRTLRPTGPSTIPSDGRPYFVELLRFEAQAETSLVLMPELVEKVLLRSVQRHEGSAPLLAGPVELVRQSGVVGWTSTLFVAPGARFELGFGPQEEIRVTRRQRTVRDETDPHDGWRRRVTQLDLYLSNLGAEERTVEVTERIPVSEIGQIRVQILRDDPRLEDDARGTTGDPVLDEEHGFVRWTVSLPGHERRELNLRWELAQTADVRGL